MLRKIDAHLWGLHLIAMPNRWMALATEWGFNQTSLFWSGEFDTII